MIFVHALKILALRWKTLAIFGCLGLAIAVAYAMTARPVFKSAASVVIDVRAPETIGQQQATGQTSPDYLLTQEDILKSDRVAKKVVESTGIAKVPGIGAQFGWTPNDGILEDYLAASLGRQMKVESSLTNSRVIEIGYLSGNPKFSADMANAFVQAFIDVSVDMQAEPARRAVEAYGSQLQRKAEELKKAQIHLAELKKQFGVIDSMGGPSAEGVGLTTLAQQLATAQAQSSIAASQAGAGALPAATANGVIANLDSQIATMEGQRALLATTAGPNNAQYRKLVNQIEELRGQRSRQQALVRQSMAAAAAQNRAAEAGILGQVSAQTRRTINAQDAQSKLAQAKLDVDGAQQAYDQMATRRTQLQILSESGQTNISLLAPALENPIPVAPRKIFAVIIGTFAGLFLGFCAVIARELADVRIRSADELEAWLGIPSFGEIRAIEQAQPFLPRMASKLLPFYGRS